MGTLKKGMQATMTKNQRLTLEGVGSFLAKLAENSESVYWLSSPDFKKIQYISPAYEKIWGRSREILYTSPELWITYLHPEDVKHHHPIQEMAEKIAKLGPHARFEENYRIVRPDGEIRWVIDRGFPIYDELDNCCGVTGIAIDITKEKQAEAELRKAKDKAEAANKAKSEFLENMRHDIRTPVTGMIALANIIKDETADLKIKEHAELLVSSSGILLEFLNEILDSIQATSGEIPLLQKKFNLKSKLEELIKLNQPRAKSKRLNLKLIFEEAIPKYFIGDAKRIYRIVLELLTNALNFTEKGEITLSASLINQKERHAIVKIEVADTGIGMPPNKQQEIFTRFKRLSPSYQGIYKGSGLGLSIVKQFVDDLEAEIYVESELNKGTIFSCLIPLLEALPNNTLGTEEVPEIQAQFASPKPYVVKTTKMEKNETEKKSILLVEDQPLSAEVTKIILCSGGLKYHVDIVTSGESAVSKVENNNYDLIFMDIGLPDISGYEATQKIRQNELRNGKKTPIVALTAHLDDTAEKNCIEAGMNAVVIKPLLKEKAVEILNRFIPEEIKEFEVIDLTLGTRLINGNLELAKEIVSVTVENLPKELVLLKKAHAINDWTGIKEITQKLRKSIHYCGVPRLQKACDNLTDYLLTEKKELSDFFYAQLITEMNAVKATHEKNANSNKAPLIKVVGVN